MDRDDAARIAREWVAAWNDHDVDAVVAHFHPDVVAVTPLAAAIGVEPSGKVRGREAVASYYRAGLARATDLHFDLEEVLVGVDNLTILYRNQRGQRVVETMVLDGGLVVRVMVGYGPS